MRLILYLNKSSKGVKGLIPVKKPVTKNGKTFMQTFYVKPDDTTQVKPSKKNSYSKKKEPKKGVTKKDIRSVVSDSLERIYPDDAPNDRPLSINALTDWVVNHYPSIKTENDLDELFDDLITADPEAVEYAVFEGDTLSDADGKLQSVTMISSGYTEYTWDQINMWVRDFSGDDLVDGFDIDEYGVYDDAGGEWRVDPWDVVTYAIGHDMSLSDAQGIFEESSGDGNYSRGYEYKPADVSFQDSSGNTWDIHDTIALGEWLSGSVEDNRSFAKSVFESRSGIDNEEPEGFSSVFNTVESHLQTISIGTKLYRGTANTTWLSLNPGDTMPLGMASFTHDKDIAMQFNGDKVLIVLENKEAGNQPRGVDVNDVSGSAENAGYLGLMDSTSISTYRDEDEVIVMAPNLEIIRKKGHTIYARVTGMHLMNKSYTDPRLIALAERTFDRHMRDDTDEGYRDAEE